MTFTANANPEQRDIGARIIARAVLVALAAIGVAAPAACKRAPPPAPPRLALRPAAEGRPALLGTLATANLERTLAEIGDLMQTVGLPVDREGARAALLGELRIPGKVAAALRPDQPAAAVQIQLPGVAEPATVLAVAVAQDASRPGADLLTAFGATAKKHLDAVEIPREPSTPPHATPPRADTASLWLLIRDGVALVADSEKALVAGGMLALEARGNAAPQDIVATAFPDAIARANGTDVKTALRYLRETVVEVALGEAHGPAGPRPLSELTQALLELLEARAGDVSTVAVSLDLDKGRGLTMRVKMDPRAGNAPAPPAKTRAQAEIPTPSAPDAFVADFAALAGTAPPELVATTGRLPLGADLRSALLQRIGRRAGKGDDAARAAADLDALAAMLTGRWSARADLAGAGAGYQLVWQLAPDAAPDRALELAARVAAAAPGRDLLHTLIGAPVTKTKSERRRDRLRLEMSLAGKDLPAADRASVQALAPKDRLEVWLASAPGRLLAAAGPTSAAAIERMQAVTPDRPPPTPAALDDALRDGKGADALFYVDLGALLKGSLMARMQSAAGQDKLPPLPPAAAFYTEATPIYASLRRGPSTTIDLRLTPNALSRLGAVARLVLLGPGAAAPF